MNFVNKLGLVLTVIFVISLLILSLQILYLLWRKKRFQQQTSCPTLTAGRHLELGSGGDQTSNVSPSKELLYFFCWKNYQASRIEPAVVAPGSVVPASAPTEDEELEDMLKLHELYGASRALFTIKEESEREEMENESAETMKKLKKDQDDVGQPKETTAAVSREVVVVIEVDEEEEDDDEIALFRTPCASPPYYTPSPSPPRDEDRRQDQEARLIIGDKITGR